jgi:endonuclease/exonuclease/phosphatase family metal-dependent hydrolase
MKVSHVRRTREAAVKKMYRILLAACGAAVVMLFASIPESLAQEPPVRLKVLSYNIHYGIGMDSKKDLERIAGVIKRIDPDIVGLQEVHDSLMTATLSRLTGMKGVFGASMEKEPPNLYRLLGIPVPATQLFYGDAILCKYPFQLIGNESIPSASSSRYEAMCVEVDLSGMTGKKCVIKCINTHFDYLETIGSRAARLASVDVIEEAFMESDPDPPGILTGDLNAVPGSAPLKYLGEKGWVNDNMNRDLFTVPSRSPRKQIDYVLYRPTSRWTVLDVSVIDEGLASDHLPILMTLELIPETK